MKAMAVLAGVCAALSLGPFAALAGRGISDRELDTPVKLLVHIRALARAKRYEAIAPLIWKMSIDNKRLTAAIIKGIRTHKRRGDFAYSDRALSEIIEKHHPRIGKLPDKLRKRFEKTFGRHDKVLARLLEKKPGAFRLFDYRGAHIIFVRHGGSYRLLFWEGLNRVLQGRQ